MSRCPNCGAQGGGPAGCGSCGLGRNPNVGRHINTGNSHGGYNRGSGGGSSCFPGDAQVLTSRGTRRLDSLKAGDEALSLDADGNVVSASIKRATSHRAEPVVRVVSSDAGLSFQVTRWHPVMTERGWVRAKDLREGDVLTHVQATGILVKHVVRAIEPVNGLVPVFNLVVDGDHTYLVHGCVAHSFVHFRRLRCWLSRAMRAISAPADNATAAGEHAQEA